MDLSTIPGLRKRKTRAMAYQMSQSWRHADPWTTWNPMNVLQIVWHSYDYQASSASVNICRCVGRAMIYDSRNCSWSHVFKKYRWSFVSHILKKKSWWSASVYRLHFRVIPVLELHTSWSRPCPETFMEKSWPNIQIFFKQTLLWLVVLIGQNLRHTSIPNLHPRFSDSSSPGTRHPIQTASPPDVQSGISRHQKLSQASFQVISGSCPWWPSKESLQEVAWMTRISKRWTDRYLGILYCILHIAYVV